MARMKDLLLDAEHLNEIGVEITHEDIVSMMITENLSESEVVNELKNAKY